MRKFTTIIGCLSFMIAGVMMTISTSNQLNAAKTVSAATIPQLYVMDSAELPLDLKLGHIGTSTAVEDTLKEVPDTVIETPKVKPTPKKRRILPKRKPKVVEPDTLPKYEHTGMDTLYVSKPTVVIFTFECFHDSVAVSTDVQ